MKKNFYFLAPFLAVLTVLAFCSESIGGDPPSEMFPDLILGKWIERKFEIYYPDGTWGIQRTEDAPIHTDRRTWRITGKTLILTYPSNIPGDNKGIQTVTETIEVLNQTQFITRGGDGVSIIRERVNANEE